MKKCPKTSSEQSLRCEIEYLYSALKSIMSIAPFGEVYEIAKTACHAYEENRKRENEN